MASCAARTPPHSFARPSGQAAFERGMAMYYGFDYNAAIGWFEQAARDGDAALARWGIALALGPNINDRGMQARMAKASAAVAEAGRAPEPSNRARDLIDALGARYSTEPSFDPAALNRAYAARMTLLAAKYPADDDIAVLHAESLMLAEPATTGHSHVQVNTAAVDAVETVLRRNPSHIGANHYHIHLLEAVDPQRALASAKRLDELRPEAGHLLHMPSHIHLRLGDHHAAVASNRRAFEADLEVRKATGRLPDMAYHTREYLAAVAGLTGQSSLAREADDSVFVQLRFNRWDDVIRRERPEDGVSRLEWHVAQVLALIGLRRIREAEAARAEFETFVATMPADEKWWSDPIATFFPLVRQEMDARMLWVKGRRDESISAWRNAVAAQDQLSRMEALMSWFHSVREPLGAALLLLDRPAEAEQVLRDELRINPGSARALFGLSKALAAQARTADALAVEKQFAEAWKNADVLLSIDGF